GFLGNKVYALDPVGNDLPGWPFVTGPSSVDARTFSSPAVGDVDGDGQLDVVIGDQQGTVHAINAKGQQIWQASTGRQPLATSPVIADADGDGRPDVIIPFQGGVDAFVGATGGPLLQTQEGLPHFEAPSVGHLRGDASWQ